MADFRIIDVDGHVQEKLLPWAELLQEPYRSLAPKLVKDHQDTSLIVAEGKLRLKPVGSLSACPILLT